MASRRRPLSLEEPDMTQALQPGATAPTSVNPITPRPVAPATAPAQAPIAAAAAPLSSQMAAQKGFRESNVAADELRQAPQGVPVDVVQGGKMAAQRAYQQGRISAEEMRSMSGQAMGRNLAQQKFDAVMQPGRTQIAQEQAAVRQEAQREQGFADVEREEQIKSDVAAKADEAARAAKRAEDEAEANRLYNKRIDGIREMDAEGKLEPEVVAQMKQQAELERLKFLSFTKLPDQPKPEAKTGPLGTGTWQDEQGQTWWQDPEGRGKPERIQTEDKPEKPEKPAPTMTPLQRVNMMKDIRSDLYQRAREEAQGRGDNKVAEVTDEQVRTEFNRLMKLAEEDGAPVPTPEPPPEQPKPQQSGDGESIGGGLKKNTITNRAGNKVDQFRNEAGEYLADAFDDGRVFNMVNDNWTPPPKVTDPSEVAALVKSGKLKPGQFFQNEKGQFLQIPGNYKAK
jgi:hypothetical protein